MGRAEEPPKPPLPLITLPVRVHLVQSETMPAMHTTLAEADIRRVFGKVNKVWAQAGIQFEIESIGPTQAVAPSPEVRLKSEFLRVNSMIPAGRLSAAADQRVLREGDESQWLLSQRTDCGKGYGRTQGSGGRARRAIAACHLA